MRAQHGELAFHEQDPSERDDRTSLGSNDDGTSVCERK